MKVGDVVIIKEWFTDYPGIVTRITKSIVFITANGHEHWRFINSKGEIIAK